MRFAALFILCLTFAGCDAPTPDRENSPVRADSSVVDAGVTLQDIASSTISVGGLGDRDSITLSDGRFVVDSDSVKLEVALLGMDGQPLSPSSLLQGDLDGDGRQEAVVIVHYSLGGTGRFYSLAAIGAAQPSNIVAQAREIASHPLGDRVRIDSLRIVPADGGPLIRVALWTHGPEDPACCATYESVRDLRAHRSDRILELRLVRDTVLRRDSTRR